MNGCPNCGGSVRTAACDIIYCQYCGWKMVDGVVVNNGSKALAR